MTAGFTLGHGLVLACIVLAVPAVAVERPMSRPAAAVVATGSPGAPAPAQASPPPERGALFVTIDRAKVIRLPDATKMVIVGNPAIADVSIQKTGIVVVTGKSYGVTNVIALDGTGNMLAESTLSVQAPNDAVVTVQRGLERQSYSCTPSCQPSVILGDAGGYFSENKSQADQHSAFATQR